MQAEHGWRYPEDASNDSMWRSNINAVLDDDPDLCDEASGTSSCAGSGAGCIAPID